MSINFRADNKTFHAIIGNGLKYTVPKFQRDYSWDSEQWEDLWQDILATKKEDDAHYMGYLVLQTADEREYQIIDGQQRITTLMIIILSVLSELKKLSDEAENEELKRQSKARFDTLSSSYIGFTDPVSLVIQPKLTLNKNNKDFFKKICAFEKLPERKIKISERQLSKAKDFFVKKVQGQKFCNGEELASFVDKFLVNKLFFTTIIVGSELNAYKVFETLNARGVQLSTPDLIKNYLFSVIDSSEGAIHKTEMEKLEDDWEAILKQLEKSDFSRFVRAHWNSKNSATQQNQLFRKIRDGINNKSSAFDYLRNLSDAAPIYAALENPGDEFWRRDGYQKAQESLKTLEVFNIVQPYGLLIAAHQNFSADEFCKILRYVEVVSIRYNVIGQGQTNRQEAIYNQAAYEISSRKITNLSGVKEKLKEIYPNDDDFYHDFARRQMKTERSPKKVSHLLAGIERFLNPVTGCDLRGVSLEHILPKNPSESWGEFFQPDDFYEYAEKFGNFTLLSQRDNKELGNKSFDEKKEFFAKSSLEITKQISTYQNWNVEAIEHRQEWLAQQAAKCWKIEF